MKKSIASLVMLLFGISILSCQHEQRDIINETFPEGQAKIEKLLDEIFTSGQKKDLERLALYHLYGPKFTEFKGGRARQDAEAGKQNERETFSAISDFKYNLRDLKVNVFGEVAIATFHGEFGGKAGQDTLAFKLQSTMVFVKDADSWKIAHEHFSPLNQSEL